LWRAHACLSRVTVQDLAIRYHHARNIQGLLARATFVMKNRKRLWFALSIALVVVSAAVFTRSVIDRRAERKRKAEYQAVTRSYAEALKPGTSRSAVEGCLRARNQPFGQVWRIAGSRNAWTDLVKIGQEKAPWYCSENNVYVAFAFDSAELDSSLLPKARDADRLITVVLYPMLEGCL
jgi:hypothetical protein